MLRRAPLLVLVLVLAAALGCSRCGKKELPSPTAAGVARYLPKKAELAVVVPDLGALGQRLAIVQGLKIASFSAQLQGFADAQQYVEALIAQLPVDVRSAEALAKAGLDPARGLGVALLPEGKAYTVVAVKDPERLGALLLSVANDRLGAGVPTTKTENGVKVTGFSQVTGSAPKLGYVVKDGFALIAADASVAGLAGWAALPAEGALSTDPELAGSLSRLPAAHDLYVYLPAGSGLAKELPLKTGVVAATLSAEALTLKADLPWTLDPAVLGALQAKPGADLLAYLPADAFVAVRFAGDPKLLAPYWARLVGPYLERAFTESAFDFKAEVLDNLKPGATVVLSVAPEAKLGAGMPALDVRRTNPFRYAHLAGIAEVQDSAKGFATLEKLPAIAPRFGARIELADRPGPKAFLTSYSQGEGVHFATAAGKVVAAAPQPRLWELLSRVEQPAQAGDGAIADPALREALQGHGAALVLDLRRLAESVKELPSEAWGIGGFAYKATTVRWLDATDDLRAVTASLDAKERSLQAELSLRFQQK